MFVVDRMALSSEGEPYIKIFENNLLHQAC